jgi:hypothetical protein
MNIIRLVPGEIPEDEVIRLAGGGAFPHDSPIKTILRRAIRKGSSLISGMGIYDRVPARATSDGITLGSTTSNIVSLPLPGAVAVTGVEAMVFFIVTIGPALEEEVDREFLQRNPIGGLFLDAVGSVAAEAVADDLVSVIADEAGWQGLRTSYRFSPGYCNWRLELQDILFRYLDGKSINVELMESYLMVPRKTISGAVLLGKRLHPLNPCPHCPSADCRDRRV